MEPKSPFKCTVNNPETTVVYRTVQNIIDHVIIPALKIVGKDPDHYNLEAFVKDWVVEVDSHALFGYFNTAPDIAGMIEEYSTAVQAQDLRFGDKIRYGSEEKTVVAFSQPFKYNNEYCVVLVLKDESSPQWPSTHTIGAEHKYTVIL